MKHRILYRLLASLALFAVTVHSGMARSGEVTGKDIHVGIIMKSYDEFQNVVIEGAEAAAREIGASFIANAPDAETGAAKQVEMIENMVTNGVNVLLIAPTLMDTVRGPLESAVDRGVKVIFVDYSDYEAFPKVTTCVGTGNYEAARTIADFFVKNFFPDPKNTRVAIVRGMLGVENHELRTRGFTEILNAAGVQILDVQDADSNADKAATYVENWIQKYGVDGIDAIMSGSDPMTLGILSAVENADALGKIKIHGFDGFQAVIQAVGEGKITFSGAQKPYKIGYDAVMRGLDAMQGKPVEKYYDPGVDLITRENYKDFLN